MKRRFALPPQKRAEFPRSGRPQPTRRSAVASRPAGRFVPGKRSVVSHQDSVARRQARQFRDRRARWIACGGPGKTVLLVSPDGAQQRSLPSPVNSFYERFVLVWSRDAATILVASSLAGRSRLDAIDVRSGNIRGIAEYTKDVIFSDGDPYMLGGSLARDGKSFATTVLKHKADLWMLEGFPQPGRPWF